MSLLLKQLCLFISLVFFQIGFLDKVYFFGLAVPLLYIYFILQLPRHFSRNIVFFLSVIIGFVIDIFSDTYGLHLLSCTVVGFFRFYFLRILSPNSVYNSHSPFIVSFGKKMYFFYLFFMVLLHQTVLFLGESFSFLDIFSLLPKFIGSVCLTIFLIYNIEILVISIRK